MKTPARSYLLIAAAIAISSTVFADIFRYDSHGKRDPFVPLVGVEKPTVTRLADITSVEDMRLEGIVSGAKGEMAAMINGEMVKVNEKVGDIVVKSITRNTVTLTVSGKICELRLSEEGG